MLRYTWRGGEKDEVTLVTNRLEPRGYGTRFRFDHTGFKGIGGFVVSRVLASVRRTMLRVGLRAAQQRREDRLRAIHVGEGVPGRTPGPPRS